MLLLAWLAVNGQEANARPTVADVALIGANLVIFFKRRGARI
jgi:hypothetical protein